ncbi:NAD(P)/FAD-dependent oxidoreductase [Achromobacter xylosoxidans]|uniref:NAD(P)/FAD-dependent oxidoreductase n=1 Tax=Alcaligenes xylosoxydans xylosoxydans TaxID=85698 RepID=UPI0006C65DA7|nr:FAD-dependent oxidoreductase [Achromobacter xylosoxidans]MCH4575835.1 FAD-binding oxidoreductase [Achromobacter xylosoxidans]MDD7988594.1 FAD-dependent oxidoreductase [Achromobacter xylosoxidans]OFO72952.1 FAD-dependent oxidoreductase [Achromobacter xylosoxidans]OMG77096.1 FAD-dependent oxidoreductase [Achromobacter xylosoxidans]PNL94625.1 FAD-binding oxidoreductase [Achromobacter xylosoxidans]
MTEEIQQAPRSPAHRGVYDAVVIGGGLVGSAVAYGLRRELDHVAVLDEGDVAYRASRGNFGLVWVQSKGMGLPRYGVWTMTSAGAWPQLAAELREQTGVDVHLEQRGGLHALLSDEEMEARATFMRTLLAQPGMAQYDWKMLDRHELADMVPGIGPEVRGATWTPVDGIANPLKLLRALHMSFAQRAVDYLPRCPAQQVRQRDGVFEVTTPTGTVRARKLVLASGLSNKALGEQVGLAVPVRPQRGQIVVLERTRRLLETPLSTLRQTDEGTWLIGDSQEEAGYVDNQVGLPILGTLADRAVRTLPALREVRVVRSWAALRVMSKDGFPIYQQSETCPGAFVATCHSGVTLAAAHALKLAPMIAAGQLADDMAPFSTRRFHVQEA